MKKIAVVVTLLLAGLAPASGAAGASGRAPAGDAPLFEWAMPSQFGTVEDEVGRLVETQPYQVRRGPWRVYLRVKRQACAPDVSYAWRVDGKRVKPANLGACRFAYDFLHEGNWKVRLKATVRKSRFVESQRVKVENWLIVSIGDSVAAGEGAPDVPGLDHAAWHSVRCHRSARAASALAAKQIEDDDGQTSVTFVHLACSGAEVPKGLLGPYGGVEQPVGAPPLQAQVKVLNRIARVRPVDAVLLSIGANDVHFGDVVRFCAIPASNCFDRILPPAFGGDGRHTVSEVLRESFSRLDARYAALARRISPRIPPSHVYITQYFDSTHDADGNTCSRILGSIDERELQEAQSQMLVPLNEAVARAASVHRWHLIEGAAQLFRNHGYCAGDNSWVMQLGRSAEDLGGSFKGRFLGTLHPNPAGYQAISILISPALEHDFYPGRTFPPRPLPEPMGDSGSGFPLAVVLGAAIAGLTMGWASLFFGVFAMGWIGLGYLLADWHASGSLILLGIALGALIAWRPKWPGIAAHPIVSLAKTIRPLLLPLLVLLAAGTITFEWWLQAVLGAALLLVAWYGVVRPEAERSKEDSGDESPRTVAKHAAIAVGAGLLVVAVARVAGIDSPYFEAVGIVSSSVLLLAIVLWFAALALRLFSFSTGRIRALFSFTVGIALLILAVAVGLLPGRPAILGEGWTTAFEIFAGCALAFLAIEMACEIRRKLQAETEPDPEDKPKGKHLSGRKPNGGDDKRGDYTRGAAKWGLTAASVAAVVLAIAIGIGLVSSAERGHAINPPEEESVEARAPGAPARATWIELARKYAPVLALTKDERWSPIRADSYAENATLKGPPQHPHGDEPWTRPRGSVPIRELPKRCPEFGQTTCYRLSIDCETGEEECAHKSSRVPGRLYRDGAVYVRVLRKGHIPSSEPRGVFIDRGPFRDRLETLIQYWYFYYYDEWEAPVFAGLLTQRHESDWEAVTIGLDETNRPLFVADSAHCAGSWQYWNEVEASTRVPGPRTHPLVAVAEGSHANYADVEQERSPDWASCAGAPAGAATALSFASNIRDRTELGWLWYPPPNGWVRAIASKPPMSFPGFWGTEEHTVLRTFRPNPIGDGEAPKTPTLQPLWQEPVRFIFCKRYSGPVDCGPE